MDDTNLNAAFAPLSTPLIADACLRAHVPLRLAPFGIRPLREDQHIAGRAQPARHVGSVDVFLEACEMVAPGDVLVIDNEGRTDEGCVGDLVALEAQAAGIGALVIWGCHRDSPELQQIGLPVFSYGTCPAGPQQMRPAPADRLTMARFGAEEVGREDVVFADADGVLFVAEQHVETLLAIADRLRQTERQQADQVRAGISLREQFAFKLFLERRAADPAYTFRQHLRSRDGAIEE